MSTSNLNLLGSITAIAILLLCILVFALRMMGKSEYLAGLLFVFCGVPLVYLLIMAEGRPFIYFLQIGLMLIFLIVELFLDYIYRYEFRKIQWMVISYATLFFASTGGMIGIAGLSGRGWSFSAIIIFLIMAIFAFIQRAKTGM